MAIDNINKELFLHWPPVSDLDIIDSIIAQYNLIQTLINNTIFIFIYVNLNLSLNIYL